MLLAFDAGNSTVSVGVFSIESGEFLESFVLTADKTKSSDEFLVSICSMLALKGIDRTLIKAAVISSVAPNLTKSIKQAAHNIVGDDVKTVGPGLKTGFPIKIDNPSELGSDIVANAHAAIEMTKGSGKGVIIIDMGTATTVSAVNRKGEYVGSSIAVGLQVSLESLRTSTELLPMITPDAPRSVIGKNSSEAVRSGVVLGAAYMLNGFIDAYEKELSCECEVFVTGGYADFIYPLINHKASKELHLTLKGLYGIYKLNTK